MNIIDGKKISSKYIEQISKDVLLLKQQYNKVPNLTVLLVGKDEASEIYVTNKCKACQVVGIKSNRVILPKEITEDEVLNYIDKLNKDNDVDAILVQLPLPKHIDTKKIIEMIDPNKDVDGFTQINMGKLATNSGEGIISCTPLGIITLLNEYNIKIKGENAVIIGSSNIVGRPLSLLLLNLGATVTICNSKTKNLKEHTLKADILISAVGKINLIDSSMIKDDVTIIDVAINRQDNGKIVGDVNFDDVKDRVKYISPVPKGVGPMTIAMLLNNTVKIAKKRI